MDQKTKKTTIPKIGKKVTPVGLEKSSGGFGTGESPSLEKALIELGNLTWETRQGWEKRADYHAFDCAPYSTEDFREIFQQDLNLEFDDSDQWFVPIHAWRIAAIKKKEELLDDIVERLLCNSDDDDWSYEELPEVLADFGPSALNPIRKGLSGLIFKEETFNYVALGDALVKMAKAHPVVREEITTLLRHHLSEYKLNPPVFNAHLVSQLIDVQDPKAASLILKVYREDFVEREYCYTWQDVLETYQFAGDFPQTLPSIQLGGSPHYSGDGNFLRILKSVGSQFAIDELKFFILGTTLSIEPQGPTDVIEEVMLDDEGEPFEFETQGQTQLFMNEFLGLWNIMVDFRSRYFPLPSSKEIDEADDYSELSEFLQVFKRKMQFTLFLDGFDLEKRNKKYAHWPEVKSFAEPIEGFLAEIDKIETLKDRKKGLIEAKKIIDALEIHWKVNYTKFARDCSLIGAKEALKAQQYAAFMAEHKTTSVGRNDPCPCVSGKKFKKCCLN